VTPTSYTTRRDSIIFRMIAECDTALYSQNSTLGGSTNLVRPPRILARGIREQIAQIVATAQEGAKKRGAGFGAIRSKQNDQYNELIDAIGEQILNSDSIGSLFSTAQKNDKLHVFINLISFALKVSEYSHLIDPRGSKPARARLKRFAEKLDVLSREMEGVSRISDNRNMEVLSDPDITARFFPAFTDNPIDLMSSFELKIDNRTKVNIEPSGFPRIFKIIANEIRKQLVDDFNDNSISSNFRFRTTIALLIAQHLKVYSNDFEGLNKRFSPNSLVAAFTQVICIACGKDSGGIFTAKEVHGILSKRAKKSAGGIHK
jgi:hypothetical protein